MASSSTRRVHPGPPGAVIVTSLVATVAGAGAGQAIQATAPTSATTSTTAVILRSRVLAGGSVGSSRVVRRGQPGMRVPIAGLFDHHSRVPEERRGGARANPEGHP